MDEGDQQFDLLVEVTRRLQQAGVDHWVGGGWAIDAHVGRTTRRHSDVDLVVPVLARDRLTSELAAAGFSPVASDAPDAVQTFVRDGVSLEITFVEHADDGMVVTPGYEGWPWLPGACGDETVEFRGVRLRVVSAEALLDTKLGWRRHVGEDPRPHDLADIQALEHHLRRTTPLPD